MTIRATYWNVPAEGPASVVGASIDREAGPGLELWAALVLCAAELLITHTSEPRLRWTWPTEDRTSLRVTKDSGGYWEFWKLKD